MSTDEQQYFLRAHFGGYWAIGSPTFPSFEEFWFEEFSVTQTEDSIATMVAQATERLRLIAGEIRLQKLVFQGCLPVPLTDAQIEERGLRIIRARAPVAQGRGIVDIDDTLSPPRLVEPAQSPASTPEPGILRSIGSILSGRDL